VTAPPTAGVIGIVVSRADPASERIGEALLELGDWSERADPDRPDADGGGTHHRTGGLRLRTFDDLHIRMDDPAPAFGPAGTTPAALVFASKHSGDTGPLLSAHHTGNFGPAELGGRDRTLAPAAPGLQKRLVAGFAEHAPPGYDVGIECTHHGPTAVSVPSVFAELGSSEAEWGDPEGARAVARSILSLRHGGPESGSVSGPGSESESESESGSESTAVADHLGGDGRRRHLVGFGGGHYAPRFGRLVRETDWAVGHVAADWGLDAMGDPSTDPGRAVVAAALRESRAGHAVIEGERPALASAVEAAGGRVVSETWVRAVGDRPLALVAALESALTAVDDGLRFGDVVPDPPAGGWGDADAAAARGTVEFHDLPGGLADRAHGVDAEAARKAVASTVVAAETTEGGTRAAGRAALPPGGDDALVDRLAGVLEGAYDEVRRREGAVVARTETFDPALARERGVPEGPAFGRLAAGETVEVDGRTVRPAEVHSRREEEFEV